MRSSSFAAQDLATAAVHAFPRPVGGEPTCDGVGEWPVECRSVGSHPRLHGDVPLVGPRGVHVDAADDVVVSWVEHGECKADASGEVFGVAVRSWLGARRSAAVRQLAARVAQGHDTL